MALLTTSMKVLKSAGCDRLCCLLSRCVSTGFEIRKRQERVEDHLIWCRLESHPHWSYSGPSSVVNCSFLKVSFRAQVDYTRFWQIFGGCTLSAKTVSQCHTPTDSLSSHKHSAASKSCLLVYLFALHTAMYSQSRSNFGLFGWVTRHNDGIMRSIHCSISQLVYTWYLDQTSNASAWRLCRLRSNSLDMRCLIKSRKRGYPTRAVMGSDLDHSSVIIHLCSTCWMIEIARTTSSQRAVWKIW